MRVVDFGVGNYSRDYTGHAFLSNYLYEKQRFLLNNSFEYIINKNKPYQNVGLRTGSEKFSIFERKKRKTSNQNWSSGTMVNADLKARGSPKIESSEKLSDASQQQRMSHQEFPSKRPINSINEIPPLIYVNKNNIPISDWDPLVDNGRTDLRRIPDRDSAIGFDQWYVNSIVKDAELEVNRASKDNPFLLKQIQYLDTYRFAKVWWKNESELSGNKQE